MKGVPKAVLLDLDGTIVHFTFDAKRIRSEIAEIFVKSRIPQDLFKPEYRISEILNKTEEYLNSNLAREEQKRVKAFKRRVDQVIERYEMEGAKNTTIINGVDKALGELKEKGIKLVIVTNNSIRPTYYTLQKIGLTDFFDIVLTREYTQFIKPHPQLIQTALKKLGLQPSEAISVGDSPVDIKASKEASVIAIGVTTGIANEETLRASGAEHVISSLNQLPSIMKD